MPKFDRASYAAYSYAKNIWTRQLLPFVRLVLDNSYQVEVGYVYDLHFARYFGERSSNVAIQQMYGGLSIIYGVVYRKRFYKRAIVHVQKLVRDICRVLVYIRDERMRQSILYKLHHAHLSIQLIRICDTECDEEYDDFLRATARSAQRTNLFSS